MITLCQCGCGEETKLSGKSQYARGHHVRQKAWPEVLFDLIESPHGTCIIWQGSKNEAFRVRRRIYITQVGMPSREAVPNVLCGNLDCVNPQHVTYLTQVERFWSKIAVDKDDECWLWMASRNEDGYGQSGRFQVGGYIFYSAHRVAFFLKYGKRPSILRHVCDNPPCCNPSHLLDGTHADNVADMDYKGRRGTAKGEFNGRRLHPERWPRSEGWAQSKLNADQVREIRLAAANGKRGVNRRLARQFNVTETTICDIIKNRTWREVTR